MAQASTSGERSEHATGLGDLKLYFEPVGFVPYRDFCIYVYKSLDAQRPEANGNATNYFYTPVLLLDHGTAKYEYHVLKRRHMVSFDVIMWSEDIGSSVVTYMQKHMKMDVERAQMNPIPFEKLMLTCSAACEAGTCANEWHSYQMHQAKTFNLICPTREDAKEIVKAMREQPAQFANTFEMKLKLSTRQTGLKETAISVGHALDGEFSSKLKEKFANRSEVLLTADDTSKLLSEATSSVKIHSFSEDVEVSPENEREIYDLLERMMVTGKEWLDGRSDKWRDSVFWNEDNYRPDRIASELNESTKKCDMETQEIVKDVVEQAGRGGSIVSMILNAWDSPIVKDKLLDPLQDLLGITLPHSGLATLLNPIFSLFGESDKRGDKRGDKRDFEERVRTFAEVMSKVEWNGDKFVPKPMELTRVNLSIMRNRQDFEDKKIVVSRSSGVFTMSVNINADTEARNWGYYERLSSELRQLKKHVDDSIADVVSRKGKVEFLATKKLAIGRQAGMISHWKAEVNVGNAFRCEMGTFSAPRDGVYAFYLRTIRPASNNSLEIMRNGQVVAKCSGKFNENFAVWHLDRNDNVCVKASYWSNENTDLLFVGISID